MSRDLIEIMPLWKETNSSDQHRKDEQNAIVERERNGLAQGAMQHWGFYNRNWTSASYLSAVTTQNALPLLLWCYDGAIYD